MGRAARPLRRGSGSLALGRIAARRFGVGVALAPRGANFLLARSSHANRGLAIELHPERRPRPPSIACELPAGLAFGAQSPHAWSAGRGAIGRRAGLGSPPSSFGGHRKASRRSGFFVVGAEP